MITWGKGAINTSLGLYNYKLRGMKISLSARISLATVFCVWQAELKIISRPSAILSGVHFRYFIGLLFIHCYIFTFATRLPEFLEPEELTV